MKKEKTTSVSQAIRELLADGRSRQEIALALGVTYRYVYSVERTQYIKKMKGISK